MRIPRPLPPRAPRKKNPYAHYKKKLTEEQVQEIRSLKGQVTQVELAKRFGVTQATISYIHGGHRWQDI